MKLRNLFSILGCALVLTGQARAADTTSANTQSLPAGISVTASATVSTDDLVELIDVQMPGKRELSAAGIAHSEAAIASLRKALAPLSDATVENADPLPFGLIYEHAIASATLVVPVASVDAALRMIRRVRWTPSQGLARTRPRDAEAIKNAAFAKVERIAKARAEAIAVAAGEHAGDLINVSPTPLDLLQGFSSGSAAMFGTSDRTDTVRVTAIFTFAIVH